MSLWPTSPPGSPSGRPPTGTIPASQVSELSGPPLRPARGRSSLAGHTYSSDPNPHQLATPHPTDAGHLCTRESSPFSKYLGPLREMSSQNPSPFKGLRGAPPEAQTRSPLAVGRELHGPPGRVGVSPAPATALARRGDERRAQRPAFQSPPPPSQLLSVPKPQEGTALSQGRGCQRLIL